jgi:hypothetical protein
MKLTDSAVAGLEAWKTAVESRKKSLENLIGNNPKSGVYRSERESSERESQSIDDINDGVSKAGAMPPDALPGGGQADVSPQKLAGKVGKAPGMDILKAGPAKANRYPGIDLDVNLQSRLDFSGGSKTGALGSTDEMPGNRLAHKAREGEGITAGSARLHYLARQTSLTDNACDPRTATETFGPPSVSSASLAPDIRASLDAHTSQVPGKDAPAIAEPHPDRVDG